MGQSRSQKNKPHKTRFSSKSSRSAHKTVLNRSNNCHKNSRAHEARAARMHRSKIARDEKRVALLAKKREEAESKFPPLILALFALSSRTNLKKWKNFFLQNIHPSIEPENVMETEDSVIPDFIQSHASIHLLPQHKLRLMVIEAPLEDLQGCLTVAKVADVIAFVTTAAIGEQDQYVDNDGKLCLSILRAQGLPTVYGLILDLVDIPVKKRSDAKKACTSVLKAELPEGSKILSADAPADCHQLLRCLSDQKLVNPHWRKQRPFVVAQQLEFVQDLHLLEKGTLLLTGHVRGRGFSVNQLVHLRGVGDFQLLKMDIIEDPFHLQRDQKAIKNDGMQIDNSASEEASILYPDPILQEPLIVENTPDELAGEQTWPTKEELMKAKENHHRGKKRNLPRGTSEYQAAWIVDESDNEANGVEAQGEPMEGVDIKQEVDKVDEAFSVDGDCDSESSVLEEASVRDDGDDFQSETMDEEELTEEERGEELKRLKLACTADEEYPDEMDTPLDVLARQRFAKYRGLKSFRTSAWHPEESLPQDYGKIFSFDNIQRSQKRILEKARDVDEGKFNDSAAVGTYVRLHIKNVPSSSAATLLCTYMSVPLVACGLLQHESKISVLHFSIKKHESFQEPLKSKESLIFHSGFRVYKTKPIFSTDDINMDKHKFERFLHPGRFSVASVFSPITLPPVPLVVFKDICSVNRLIPVASGSLKSVDPNRIILKRIVLSGYPHRVHKQKAVVKFMFHNPEDVCWFKPLELWTKYGRRGRIKEPVGTHGAMKCIFDGVIQQRDSICVSLYKRVYPKLTVLNS